MQSFSTDSLPASHLILFTLSSLCLFLSLSIFSSFPSTYPFLYSLCNAVYLMPSLRSDCLGLFLVRIFGWSMMAAVFLWSFWSFRSLTLRLVSMRFAWIFTEAFIRPNLPWTFRSTWTSHHLCMFSKVLVKLCPLRLRRSCYRIFINPLLFEEVLFWVEDGGFSMLYLFVSLKRKSNIL